MASILGPNQGVVQGEHTSIFNLIIRNCFLPVGKWHSQREALLQGPYLVVIAIGEKLLASGVFQKTSLGGEGKLGKEVGPWRLLCCGLKGKTLGYKQGSSQEPTGNL